MRKDFKEAYLNLETLPNRREIFNEKPISPQESFLLMIGNIMLDARKE